MSDGNGHLFGEYYRSETNRRLENIEKQLSTLMQMRAQLLLVNFLGSALVSSGVTWLVAHFLRLGQ